MCGIQVNPSGMGAVTSFRWGQDDLGWADCRRDGDVVVGSGIDYGQSGHVSSTYWHCARNVLVERNVSVFVAC